MFEQKYLQAVGNKINTQYIRADHFYRGPIKEEPIAPPLPHNYKVFDKQA